MDTYPNRLAMLFCLRGGKNIDSSIWIRPTDSTIQFPLFNDSGRTRLKDNERIWGKVSRYFTSTSPTPLNCVLQLYDICVSRDTPYFAVTNYYGWVFGVFSKGLWSI
jgi:hypothetical protein